MDTSTEIEVRKEGNEFSFRHWSLSSLGSLSSLLYLILPSLISIGSLESQLFFLFNYSYQSLYYLNFELSNRIVDLIPRNFFQFRQSWLIYQPKLKLLIRTPFVYRNLSNFNGPFRLRYLSSLWTRVYLFDLNLFMFPSLVTSFYSIIRISTHSIFPMSSRNKCIISSLLTLQLMLSGTYNIPL